MKKNQKILLCLKQFLFKSERKFSFTNFPIDLTDKHDFPSVIDLILKFFTTTLKYHSYKKNYHHTKLMNLK